MHYLYGGKLYTSKISLQHDYQTTVKPTVQHDYQITVHAICILQTCVIVPLSSKHRCMVAIMGHGRAKYPVIWSAFTEYIDMGVSVMEHYGDGVHQRSEAGIPRYYLCTQMYAFYTPAHMIGSWCRPPKSSHVRIYGNTIRIRQYMSMALSLVCTLQNN